MCFREGVEAAGRGVLAAGTRRRLSSQAEPVLPQNDIQVENSTRYDNDTECLAFLVSCVSRAVVNRV